MPALSQVTEVKRTLAGVEKRFSCQLLAGEARHAVVLWIAPAAMSVHGVELPAGTISFGHFWSDRFYNVYHWLGPAGQTLGYYFNIADETRFSPGRLEWRDLAVDVLVTPTGRLDVVDEHELPADLDPALRARVEAGLRAILDDPASVTAEIEARGRALWPLAFPDAA
jgi:Protein of unknown function (DUF402)